VDGSISSLGLLSSEEGFGQYFVYVIPVNSSCIVNRLSSEERRIRSQSVSLLLAGLAGAVIGLGAIVRELRRREINL
jgi:hypothetical protein